MKTTKPTLKLATDSFYWTMANYTGGTRKECLKSAPYALTRLQEHADKIKALAANQNAACAKDSHLQERMANIPARIATFKERYLSAPAPATPEQLATASMICGEEVAEILSGADTLPANIIHHNFAA